MRDEFDRYATAARGIGPWRQRERECLVEICDAIYQLMCRLGHDAELDDLMAQLVDDLDDDDQA